MSSPKIPAPKQSSHDMVKRKEDHIDIVIRQRKEAATFRESALPPASSPVSGIDAYTSASSEPNPSCYSDFDKVRLPHDALPDCDLPAIDLSSRFLGHDLSLPFLISSMTGGPARAESINTHLAETANQLGLAMGVGSQRVALAHTAQSGETTNAGLEKRIRMLIGRQPLFANLGAVQLIEKGGMDMAKRAVDALEADALILHLNPMQEVMQRDGDIFWQGVAGKIQTLIADMNLPVIIKEVGFGITAPVAKRLANLGASAIDIAGRGGTNFGLVEGARAPGSDRHYLSEIFADWGQTTADLIPSVRHSLPHIPLIASGGIRHGLDAAKALYLGADLVGQAGSLLEAALISTEAVLAHFSRMEQALKIALFGTGTHDLKTFKLLNKSLAP